jgi:hypothetical protein
MNNKKNSDSATLNNFFKEHFISLPPFIRSDENEKILYQRILAIAMKKMSNFKKQ